MEITHDSEDLTHFHSFLFDSANLAVNFFPDTH